MPIFASTPRVGLIGLALAIGPAPARAQEGKPAPAAPPPSASASVATPTATAPKPPTRAERAVDEAIDKLKKLESVTAKLEVNVDALGQKFDLKGEYARAPKEHVRLLLNISGMPDAKGRMLQICDGATLWEFVEVLEAQRFSKIDVGKVLAKLDDPGFDAETRLTFRNQLGFAGPDALLVSLRKAIEFDALEESMLDGKPVWIARGKWKDRQALNVPDQQPLAAIGPLPAYIPSVAAVWIGKADGWPYKVKMDGEPPSLLTRTDTRKVGVDGKPLGSRSAAASFEVQTSHLVITYTDVALNGPWKPEDFAFAPPRGQAEQVADMTNTYVSGMEGYLANEAAKKKAGAPKAAEKSAEAPVPVKP